MKGKTMEYIDNSAIAAIIIAILGTVMVLWMVKESKKDAKIA